MKNSEQAPVPEDASFQEVVARIARELLRIKSLQPRPDGDNFELVCVMGIQAALVRAYEAGRASAQTGEAR